MLGKKYPPPQKKTPISLAASVHNRIVQAQIWAHQPVKITAFYKQATQENFLSAESLDLKTY